MPCCTSCRTTRGCRTRRATPPASSVRAPPAARLPRHCHPSRPSRPATPTGCQPTLGAGDLRAKMLQEQNERPRARNQHVFRSPFECAGVQGYTLPEVERAFDTRSRDSQFWPLFQLFHTLLPPYAAPPPEEISLEEFLGE